MVRLFLFPFLQVSNQITPISLFFTQTVFELVLLSYFHLLTILLLKNLLSLNFLDYSEALCTLVFSRYLLLKGLLYFYE